MTRLLALLFAALSCASSFASTDCASSVATITVETGGGYVVSLNSGLSFAMAPKSPAYREIFGMAMASQSMGRGLIARFATDSVNCNRIARRTDLIAIVLGQGETSTMTTPATTTPSTTVVTQPASPR